IVLFMGGIRSLTAREDLIVDVTALVSSLACVSLPIWVLGFPFVLFRSKPAWCLGEVAGWRSPTMPLSGLAIASLLVWVFILPLTQPEQQRRRSVEVAFAEDRIADALAEMSRYERTDFPPGWEPPPQGRRSNEAQIDALRPVLK